MYRRKVFRAGCDGLLTSRQEHSHPQANFVPQVEKGQEIRYSRTKSCFRCPEKEAAHHFSRPGLRGGLQRRDDAPGEADEGGPVYSEVRSQRCLSG